MSFELFRTAEEVIHNVLPHFTTVFVLFLIQYGLIIIVVIDVASYEIFWEFFQDWAFIEVFNQRRFELGLLFILWSFASYVSAITITFLIGAIALSAKYYLFNEYINQTLIAYVLYVIGDNYFISWSLRQYRMSIMGSRLML